MDRTGNSIAGRLISVVDDDVAVRNSLKFSLEIEGLAVQTYASANELLDAPNVSSSSCLIIDQNMPDVSGLDLLAILRARGILVPAILVSTNVTPALRAAAARKGVAVVEKPFLGDALLNLIRVNITGAR